MAEPVNPYPAPSREIVELARRPGLMLLIIVLWPAAVVAAISAWALHLEHLQHASIIAQCAGG